MDVIGTDSTEDVVVAALGDSAVMLEIRSPGFGTHGRVRLSHEQTVALASALTGVVLERGAAALDEA